jgi:hypothetical protein
MDTVQVESNVLAAVQSRGVSNRAVIADGLLVVRPGLKCGSNLKPFTLVPEGIKVVSLALQSNFSLQTSESNGIQQHFQNAWNHKDDINFIVKPSLNAQSPNSSVQAMTQLIDRTISKEHDCCQECQ